MKVIVGKTAGFCYGVGRAVAGAKEELKKSDTVYCLGDIVHNENVIKSLKGLKVIDDIKQAKGKAIIRSHGVAKEVYQEAESFGVELIDLTCPGVIKVHKIAEEYCRKGFFIILMGKPNHPEIIGTKSFCGENVAIIYKENDIENAIEKIELSNINNILITAQTTYNSKIFDDFANKIKAKLVNKNIEIKKTICNDTESKEHETEELAKKVDFMIIIGGKTSANSNKLYDIASEHCKNTIFVSSAEEIDLNNIKDVTLVGIMAGASTSDKDIEEVKEKILSVERN